MYEAACRIAVMCVTFVHDLLAGSAGMGDVVAREDQFFACAGIAGGGWGSFEKLITWARSPKFGVILEYPATS